MNAIVIELSSPTLKQDLLDAFKGVKDEKYLINIINNTNDLHKIKVLIHENIKFIEENNISIKGRFKYTENGLYNQDQHWYLDGYLHRDYDKPSILTQNGTEYYFKHGKKHREGKPAIIVSNGRCVNEGHNRITWGIRAEEYWQNNQPHREGFDENGFPLPAYIEYSTPFPVYTEYEVPLKRYFIQGVEFFPETKI